MHDRESLSFALKLWSRSYDDVKQNADAILERGRVSQPLCAVRASARSISGCAWFIGTSSSPQCGQICGASSSWSATELRAVWQLMHLRRFI